MNPPSEVIRRTSLAAALGDPPGDEPGDALGTLLGPPLGAGGPAGPAVQAIRTGTSARPAKARTRERGARTDIGSPECGVLGRRPDGSVPPSVPSLGTSTRPGLGPVSFGDDHHLPRARGRPHRARAPGPARSRLGEWPDDHRLHPGGRRSGRARQAVPALPPGRSRDGGDPPDQPAVRLDEAGPPRLPDPPARPAGDRTVDPGREP